MKKHIEYVLKIGTRIDSWMAPIYVDKAFQDRKIAEAKERWKHAIQCELMIISELVAGEGDTLPHLEFKTVPNPYYGWKESQLKIVKI